MYIDAGGSAHSSRRPPSRQSESFLLEGGPCKRNEPGASPQSVFDCPRLLVTKGTPWVCGGVEEIDVGLQQKRGVTGSKAHKEDGIHTIANEASQSLLVSGDKITQPHSPAYNLSVQSTGFFYSAESSRRFLIPSPGVKNGSFYFPRWVEFRAFRTMRTHVSVFGNSTIENPHTMKITLGMHFV